MQEAQRENAEDNFVTACFYVGREFKLSPNEILQMKSTQFDVLLEEMDKHYKLEKKQAEDARKKGMRG